ncbi:MAG: DUF1761 domain-containing protein [Candidatus Nanopelagicales bacterium]|nr:DUF1761 domain-containing protein [Candidatus Nanopelagicales bacterium]
MIWPSINVLAIVLATISSFVVGFVWFSPPLFFTKWWAALGKEGDPGAGQNMKVAFGLVVLGSAVQAVFLALVIGWIGLAGVDINLGVGALTGALMGIGFAAAPSLGHRLFAGQGLKVWAIEVGGDIAALVVMGAIIGAFG